MKIVKLSRSNFVGPKICAGLFGLLMIAALCPMTGGAYADEDQPAAQNDEGISAQANMTLGLSFDNNVTKVSRDVVAGTPGFTAVGMTVTADNVGTTGAQLYVQAAGGSSNALTLATDTSKTVGAVSGSVTGSSMAPNTWGYALQNGSPATTGTDADIQTALGQLTYRPVAASGDTSAPAKNSLTDGDLTGNYTLAFGANIGTGMPAGHYGTNVLVSLAAGAGEVTNLGFEDLTYMQDMADYKCYVAKVGETKQLIDSRDNKKYWVTKLADGNCWMTQNLDLDLDGVTLKPADSDVTSDWVSTTGPSGLWSTTSGTDDYNKVNYYNAGEYVYTNPTTSKNCNAGADGLAGGTCAADGWVNVSGMTASSDPNFGTGVVNNTYNAHYSIGNYYSWTAATVESGNNLTTNNTDATSSICPKGWQLPYAGRDKFNNNYQSPEAKDPANNIPINRNKSFINLLEAYGWGPGINNMMWGGRDDWGNPYAPLSASSYNIASTPLHLLRGGFVSNGSLNGAGSEGNYWSSTASGASNAYGLGFGSSNVYSSYYSARYNGFSVRCVAR